MFVGPMAIPSPAQSVWYLGPFPVRAYAICVLTGIVLAVWLGSRRYERRGGDREKLFDLALWVVPFGIVGARVYHVLTSPQGYFGPNTDPWLVFKVWEGGLAIWGGIIAGFITAVIVLKKMKLAVVPVLDSLAPGIAFAQAIGRVGNYFNQELYGKPTTLPWGLKIDQAHLRSGYEVGTLFHPTFLYELLWNLTAGLLLLFIDKKKKLAGGQLFSLYIVFYMTGRVWVESLRIDDAHYVFGVRLNIWASLLMGAMALVAWQLFKIRKYSTMVTSDQTLAVDECDTDNGGDEGLAVSQVAEQDDTEVTGADDGRNDGEEDTDKAEPKADKSSVCRAEGGNGDTLGSD